MTFPMINHIDELKAQVGHQPEIRFMTNEFGFTIVCYVVGFAETFTSENKIWARECRGITFDPQGNIHSRPLHKFFNMGELAETQPDQIEWTKLKRAMDKRDGSMVHPVLVNGYVMLKTKKSFTSDVAVMATKYMSQKRVEIEQFCRICITQGMTPIFEYTSPMARIVLDYKDEDLRLLHVRDNVTGQYLDPKFILDEFGFECTIKLTDEYQVDAISHDAICTSLETDQDREGYVLMFEDGSMVKAKTQWYLQMHRTIVFVRERDIAEMVLDETIDDYKSFLSMSGKALDKVLEIEHRVMEETRLIETQIDELYAKIKDCPDRKTAAMTIPRDHQFFGAAMNKFNGKEFDIKDYFKKNVLREKFSLGQV